MKRHEDVHAEAVHQMDTSILYPAALEHFPKNRDSALEIGCGRAKFTYELAHIFKNVIGVDKDPKVIAEARKKWSMPNLRFFVTNAESLDTFFKGVKFDLILMIFTLHHCSLERVLFSLKHLLAKDGTLVIVDVYAKRCNSVGEYILVRILEIFRRFPSFVKSVYQLGLFPVLSFHISMMQFLFSRSGRGHIADDLLNSRSYSLQEWRESLNNFLPMGSMSVLLPSVMMYTWNCTAFEPNQQKR